MTARVLAFPVKRAVRPAPARSLPDGTPHPVPAMAAHGWHARGGVYVRPAKTKTTGRSR
jgi:hypothetical protein